MTSEIRMEAGHGQTLRTSRGTKRYSVCVGSCEWNDQVQSISWKDKIPRKKNVRSYTNKSGSEIFKIRNVERFTTSSQ
jgi:hypothetical protein